MFNARKRTPKAPTQLEQLVLDFVWSHPNCTADSCREGIAGHRPLKDSTIRTILRNLEAKGYLTHIVDGRTYVYSASETPRNIAVQAVARLIDRFCGGSVEELIVGLVDNQVLDAKRLQKLAEKIASHKEKKG
jgi:predicted transcriptional regulator